jgi:hypothetical protein
MEAWMMDHQIAERWIYSLTYGLWSCRRDDCTS